MISRISSISCSHAPAIPADEGRIYSRIGQVLRPCVGIASVKDSYSAYTKDRFENFQVVGQARNSAQAGTRRSMNHWLLNLTRALAAAFQKHKVKEPNAGFAHEKPHLIIIRA